MVTNVRLSGAQTSARSESDIRYNYNNLNQIIAASNNLSFNPQAQFYSSDGGATWSQTNLPAVAGDSNQSDPAVDWTSDGTAWALTVGVGSSNVVRAFKSTDQGATWTFDATISGTQTNVDKPMLWVDHSPSSPHKDNIYALWWNSGPTYVARRAGPGGTWQAPVQVSGAETTGGSDGGDIKTNTFGDVFAFWPSEADQKLFVAKSTDGGATFGTPVQIANTFSSFLYHVPADEPSRGALLYITGGAHRTATQDSVYAIWMDLAGGAGCNTPANEPGTNVNSTCKTRIWYSRSTDGGATWSAPVKINDQASLNDQFFPRLAVDETSGDMVVVYYDTVDDPARLKTDLWMQTSTDGGASWSAATKVTTSETDETVSGFNTYQYGDYIGLTGYAGQFFACWTDRRSGGFEEIWGAPLPLVQRAATFQIHRDHYGQDEIDAARTQSTGPVIKTGFWLAVDGFTARELGITGPSSTNLGPAITFSPATGVSASCTSLDSTDPAFQPDVLARFRFGYDVNFGPDDSAFGFAGQTVLVTITATFQGLPAVGQITFMKQPDPNILQGPQTWWLSNDIRLVQVAQGDTAFSVTMGTDPVVFLQQITAALEAGNGTAGGQTFDVNTAEDNEVISVAPQTLRGGQLVNVYNFAVARVHYQARSQPANDVRVFFRLFAANSTATDFHADTTYSRDPSAYPVPPANFGQHTTPTSGVVAGEYVSVPCFAAPRQDATQAGAANSLPALQFDTANDRNLPPTGGPIKDFYYGCFLDINGTTPALPQGGLVPAGNANGPWPAGSGVTLESVRQSFIRNDHQCIVAEIAFDPDPINPGTQPWNSDKLAQRNISWSYAANPGVDVSRGAIETFEVRPTPSGKTGDPPDEIMIDWLNVPANQHAEIYLPAVSADAVLARASRLYPTHRLSRVGAATIGCLTGGITYIPLPEGSGDGANFAGLMQISLPPSIKRGQLYQVVVRQLTNAYGTVAPPPPPPPQLTVAVQPQTAAAPAPLRWRKVLGTFQINIPVSTKELLLGREELRLSIFRWIAEGIPHASRWWPVFRRYLELIAIRVGELGGDPGKILPSPNGYGGLPSPYPEPERPHERHEYTGKVEALVYDHFGDFDGFVLELHDGDRRRFDSREGEIEELVREAWEGRIVTTVVVSGEHRHRPLSILLKRSSGWRPRE
jgi:hypothetical protein